MLSAVLERYRDGLSQQAYDAFHANVGREIDAARVLGFVDSNRFAEARTALADVRAGLPDGQAAALERTVARGEQSASLGATAMDALAAAELGARIARAEDVTQEITTAERAGTLHPAEAQRLRTLQQDAQSRSAHAAELARLGAEAARGGARLDPHRLDHRVAAELFWRGSLSHPLDRLDPPKRLDVEVNTVARLGVVPKALQVRIVAGLTGVDPGAAVLAARQVVGILQQRPDMADQFAPGLAAVADRIWQASTAGATPEEAVGFARAAGVEPDASRPAGTRRRLEEPSVAAEAAAAAGEKIVDLTYGRMTHEVASPTTLEGRLYWHLLTQLMQAPSANLDMHVERLAAINKQSAETYLRMIGNGNDRLDPRHLDELGIKEMKAQQEAARGWLMWLFEGW
jgi:hypothetical protein